MTLTNTDVAGMHPVSAKDTAAWIQAAASLVELALKTPVVKTFPLVTSMPYILGEAAHTTGI